MPLEPDFIFHNSHFKNGYGTMCSSNIHALNSFEQIVHDITFSGKVFVLKEHTIFKTALFYVKHVVKPFFEMKKANLKCNLFYLLVEMLKFVILSILFDILDGLPYF